MARSNHIENRNLVSNHPPHTINSLMAGRVKKERLNTLRYLNIQDDLSKERRGMCGLQGLGEILCEVRSFPRTFTIIHLREPIDMLLYCLVWKLRQSGARRHRAERSPWPNPSLAVSCPMYRNCTTTLTQEGPEGHQGPRCQSLPLDWVLTYDLCLDVLALDFLKVLPLRQSDSRNFLNHRY